MAELPEGLDREASVGANAAGFSRVLRGIWMAVLVGVLALALTGALGQKERTTQAAAGPAWLELRTANTVRSGLFFQAQIDVTARARIEAPTVVLDEGWLDGLQINTIEPSPVSASSRDGRLALAYDTLEAGDRLLVSMHFQVEPTQVGFVGENGVELDDGTTLIARLPHRLRRLP